MQPDLHRYINAAWLVLVAVWFAGALTAKRATRTEGAASRLAHMALLALAMALLFSGRWHAGPLTWRFVPESAGTAYAGLALTVAGVGFAIWARAVLGGNWSGTVTIKKDHTLVRRGPYRVVRHPIYTGCLFGFLGTAISFGELRGLAGTAIALLSFWLKSRLEERFLTEQFGSQYEQYRREVRALMPFVL